MAFYTSLVLELAQFGSYPGPKHYHHHHFSPRIDSAMIVGKFNRQAHSWNSPGCEVTISHPAPGWPRRQNTTRRRITTSPTPFRCQERDNNGARHAAPRDADRRTTERLRRLEGEGSVPRDGCDASVTATCRSVRLGLQNNIRPGWIHAQRLTDGTVARV